MAQDFGSGVSRTLSALERQFQTVVWQASKPPLDSELNLMAQVDWERAANIVRAQMHSGFLLDPMGADMDFVTSPEWSNWFKMGRVSSSVDHPIMWANVNGWVLPITGSGVAGGDESNRVNLFNPPATDARIDFVFLEVWMAQIAPNPSTGNKPSASTIYRFGNTEYGGTNITDEMEDPAIGFETTERCQLQYRIRVVGSGTGLGNSVDLAQYPDGLDDPNVLARGAMTTSVVGYPWVNMGDTLSDKGLWRSGNGDSLSRTALGTVDGYSYAIPVCAVFRRNTNPFVALTNSGNANQNGGLNRNPTSTSITTPVEATRTFTPVTLTADLTADAVGNIAVTGLSDSGLDNTNISWASMALMLDGEIIVIESVDVAGGTVLVADPTGASAIHGRGRFGTMAVPHVAGTQIQFFNFRPDGRYADEIASEDILDLRRSVTAGEWSYEDLLKHNLGRLLTGNLRTSYKQGSGTDTQGLQILEVDTYLGKGTGSLPNQTEQLDGFDGIRTVFSDAASVQNDVSLLLSPVSGGGGTPTAVSSYISSNDWDAAALFIPSGFQPSNQGWANGTTIGLYLGGTAGTDGARATSSTGDMFMRFVSPKEYWLSRDGRPSSAGSSFSTRGNQFPFLLRFLSEAWSDPAATGEAASDHPGPMYPLPELNFEGPFIVLGGLANTSMRDTSGTTVITGAVNEIRFNGVGLDFDAPGGWWDGTTLRTTKLTGITNLLLHGKRNLWDLLTAGGTDPTGRSSELYVVLSGDTTNGGNTGCFRVVGAGTVAASYTTQNATTADALVLVRVGAAASYVAGRTVTVEARTQEMNTQDSPGSAVASAVIVITDIEGTGGGAANPWDGDITTFSASDLVIDTSILYGPSRGAMARVGDTLSRFTVENPAGEIMLREAPEDVDPDPTGFRSRTGVPENEYYYAPQPVQAWNRLASLGYHAPIAPAYGSGRYNFETLRESELFVDEGSKTVVFRPFQQVSMSLPVRNTTFAQIGTYTAGTQIDAGNLFGAAASTNVLAVPPEYMPRFGRQDIPIRGTAGASGPYIGINHLFGDSPTVADNVFDIIGGPTTATTLGLVTGASSGFTYGSYGAITGSLAGYQGRLYEDVNARSADINKPLRAIQLPPNLGIVRVFGVYDYRDYVAPGANGSAWTDKGFTPDTGAAAGTNLLRTDASKQTMFILKDGAEDVTGTTGDHTYMIPEEAIDITLSPNYVAGDTFNTMEFVVEMTVFGFARGFIDSNNYVVLRADSPATVPSVISSVSMILPLAAPLAVRGYSAYLRTVYQGDPYMTRAGATIQIADYENRYGQVPVAKAFAVNAPLQQYTAANSQIPEIPNARSLEILASTDFWTTLGTGKIAGPVNAGTVTDPGFLGSVGSRLPGTGTDNPYQPEVRAFTAPQTDAAPRGSMIIHISNNAAITTESVSLERDLGTDTASVVFTGWVAATADLSATTLAALINADTVALATLGVWAAAVGNEIHILSFFSGKESNDTIVTINPVAGDAVPQGIHLRVPRRIHLPTYRSPLLGGKNLPMNGALDWNATTPIRLTGMTDRLPLGILVNDSDFIGEDPMLEGEAYSVRSGGTQSTTEVVPFAPGGEEYARLNGNAGTMGMADGSILQYTAYNATSAPDGTKRFRLYRGGGSAYVLDSVAGGPVDFSAGGFPEMNDPVVKGAVLTGRAYLVRNQAEVAFTGNVTRSYGDEVQMVVVTSAVYGKGALCGEGYSLDGIISPTDYGKGYSASDRYRLEGKPLVKGRAALPNPDIELAPYPPEDPADDDPCA